MECLSRCLDVVEKKKEFKHHPRCKKLNIIHMMFADDLLMFARADIPFVSAIFQAFTKFSKASGLEANLHKSDVYVAGVPESAANQIVDALGIAKVSFPFKYLGVPLTTRKLSYTECKPLIEKTVIFVMPKKVMKEIQKICRMFLWSGTGEGSAKAPVSWESLCLPNHVPNGLTWSIRKIWANREVFVEAGDADKFIKHGKYSIQKMYLNLRKNASSVTWKRIVCNSKASPKATFIVWLALQNRLATKETLLKWNMQIHGDCVIYQTQLETLEHLFF
ncbi:uncharacterized protein [Spinacia oleracea]|uniref:Reverse transcriptase zinc-binding domain-containing protein n=1 Tax=Spinacia oleracea TaxID=3562 RepID=A0ABM3RS55_SPIOL|nr:uncharacterized protein LOC130472048 [Spinacia oleracea]